MFEMRSSLALPSSEGGDVKVIVARPLEEAGFINGFSLRLGGISPLPHRDLNLAFLNDDSNHVIENRLEFRIAVLGQQPASEQHRTMRRCPSSLTRWSQVLRPAPGAVWRDPHADNVRRTSTRIRIGGE